MQLSVDSFVDNAGHHDLKTDIQVKGVCVTKVDYIRDCISIVLCFIPNILLRQSSLSQYYWSNSISWIFAISVCVPVYFFGVSWLNYCIQSNITILYLCKDALAIMDGRRVVVYEVTGGAPPFRVAGSFNTTTRFMCLQEQNIYTVESGKIQVHNYQVNCKLISLCANIWCLLYCIYF